MPKLWIDDDDDYDPMRLRDVAEGTDWLRASTWAFILLFILFFWSFVVGAFMSADPPEIVPTGINELAAGAGNQFERLHTCSSGGMAAADVGVTRDYRSLWAASHARHVAIPHAGGSCGMRLSARAASRDRRLQ